MKDRFDAVQRDLDRLAYDVRVFAPVAGQIGAVEATVGDLERSLTTVIGDVRDLARESARAVQDAKDRAAAAERVANDLANDVIRTGRAENLKLIGVVLGSFTTIATAILGTLAALGKFG
jgi:hypothetical protein